MFRWPTAWKLRYCTNITANFTWSLANKKAYTSTNFLWHNVHSTASICPPAEPATNNSTHLKYVLGSTLLFRQARTCVKSHRRPQMKIWWKILFQKAFPKKCAQEENGVFLFLHGHERQPAAYFSPSQPITSECQRPRDTLGCCDHVCILQLATLDAAFCSYTISP